MPLQTKTKVIRKLRAPINKIDRKQQRSLVYPLRTVGYFSWFKIKETELELTKKPFIFIELTNKFKALEKMEVEKTNSPESQIK